MTPDRMRQLRFRMGDMPVRVLARWTDRAEGTLRGMELRKRPIPETLNEWLDRLDRWTEENPPPEKMDLEQRTELLRQLRNTSPDQPELHSEEP